MYLHHSEDIHYAPLVSGANNPILIKSLMGCVAFNTVINLHQSLPAWSTVIFFDTVLFFLTLIKTWKACKKSTLFPLLGES